MVTSKEVSRELTPCSGFVVPGTFNATGFAGSPVTGTITPGMCLRENSMREPDARGSFIESQVQTVGDELEQDKEDDKHDDVGYRAE
jgi:hypothetical protein